MRTITRLAGAVAMLILGVPGLFAPGDAVAEPRTRIVVNSTDGQPNAGEPGLWTGTVFRDGPRAREVRSAGTSAAIGFESR